MPRRARTVTERGASEQDFGIKPSPGRMPAAAALPLPTEVEAWRAHRDPARFLAKRFAAKEAFGKALGTGVAVPATLHAVAVGHDSLGKPRYVYDERLTLHMENNCLRAHLSITDEDDTVVAFAVIEQA